MKRGMMVFAIVVIPSLVQADEKKIRVADIPREFTGTFEWRSDEVLLPATLTIEKIEEKDGVITFTGVQHYANTGSQMKVEGTILVRNRRITIRESELTNTNAVIDGSFEGTISPDMQMIDAIWTTDSNGSKGDLRHMAKKTSALGNGLPLRK